jgi:ATP-dependent Lon protease
MNVMKKVLYGLLSFLIVVLIMEHFLMSTILSTAFKQMSGGGGGASFASEQQTGDEYGDKLEKLVDLPDVYKKGLKELRELGATPGMTPQASEIRNYLDWFFSVPWLKEDKTEVDLKKAKKILDRDHQGLDKAKDHILEYLAVQKRVPNGKAPILCFVGPPGVGKTTLAKSIAEATGRKFVRISLGGVRDEGNIRGFLRTYVGSKPGDIVKALKEAGTSNPVILLDEIDKMGTANHHGDPAAALLEVLDPAQNGNFKDHFLEIGIDLSKVLFIATANDLKTIPPALADRLELFELESYTRDEKIAIAKEHLIPKQLKDNGLKAKEFEISDEAIKQLISEYTMESGVRNLDRLIGTLCRKALKEFDDGAAISLSVTGESLAEHIGAAKIPPMKAMKEDTIGKTQGLSWSPVGGGVLALEAVVLPGKGKIVKTGNLGETSQESIMAAMTAVRSMFPEYNVDPRFLENKDIHIHFPAGGKKDGPSAGITIATAVMSAITKIPVSKDVCMTGEINLHGDVMPIGGLKEKLIAAHSIGLKVAVISIENVSSLEDVPQQVKDEMEIYPVKHISEVLKIALVK